jgi:hypothetical protein
VVGKSGKIENEGFNRQKNSGLNLEHAYSIDPEKMRAYYYLLQIAFMLTQLRRQLVTRTPKQQLRQSVAYYQESQASPRPRPTASGSGVR